MITHSRLDEKLEMQFQRVFAIVLLCCGGVLIIMGLGVSDSPDSQFLEFIAGLSANKAMWLMLGGAAFVVAGASMSYTSWQK